MLKFIAAALAGFAFLVSIGVAPTRAADSIQLPYEEFRLANGLRVIVHEDRKAPLVAVSVWYHVGSKDEPEGKTGFAHLFEHLMFNGSEHYDGEWFLPLDEVGATDANGTTWFDRTNYFQTVPTTALERILWMESDRMGHLLGAIDQKKLDEQRDVVKNEKRQGDNQPYGRVEYSVLAGLLPKGHPYAHSTIGSMEDLNAASLADVKAWFTEYYGAANAVIVLAGDIDAKTARPLVERYFGDIPAGPPLTRAQSNAPKLASTRREIMYDRVPQARIIRNWVAPGRATREAVLLYLAADALGGGKTSRLYRKLVDDLRIATAARAELEEMELMSFFSTTVDVKPGADRAAAEKAMADTIAEFLAKGPTVAELARSKTSIEAGVIRGLEKVGGFRGKAAILAEGALYADDPGFILKQLEWLRAATPADVLAAARDVMSAGHYQIDVLPFPEFTTTASSVNRKTGLPAVASTPDLEFPDIAEARLANGMKVVMARRAAIPVVNIALQFDAGYSSDSVSGARLGAASFASAMLDEGTKRRTAQQIAEQAASLGAQIAVGSSLDSTSASLSALKSRLAPSLDLLADIVRNPSFDQSEIDKLRGLWLARIEQEKADPVRLALRVLPPELYGSGHAYGVPFTGSGTVDEIKALTRADLVRFHETWIRPDNATIFVVGDTTLAEIKPLLERAFGDWRAPARPKATKNVASVSRPARGKAIIIDKPGSPQSLILAGVVAPPTGAPNNVAITAMNDVLGGQFTARINMNLREAKGWAYGAYTFLQDARGQRPYLVYAPVQTDKTRESIAEILREMKAFKTTAPASAEELTRAVNINTRSLPGSFETAGAVLGSLAESERFGRPWDYPAGLKEAYEALTRADIAAAAAEAVHPESLIWVIVGDRAKIEAGVRALNLGDVEVRSISDL